MGYQMKNLKSGIVFILFLALSIIISNCSKDSSPVSATQTNEKLLTQTSWQAQKILDISSKPGQSVDVTNQFPFISMTFNTDGTYHSSLHNGNWQLSNQGATISFDNGSDNKMTADVLELNSTIFHVKMNIPISQSNSNYEITFIPLKPSSNISPAVNFDTLWSEYNLRYSFFKLKYINWDSLYNFYRPQITNTTTDPELFHIMSSLLNVFKDGHVNLITPYGNYSYSGWYAGHPANFLGLNIIRTYLSSDYGTAAGGYMHYGKISNNLGYIYIGTNFTGDVGAWSDAIDVIIDSLKDTKGIIVDIRNNGGGSDNLSSKVAARFTDKQRTFAYVQWKIMGPNHSNFTDYEPYTIPLIEVRHYTKPVAILINRHCFSSAEEFFLMFKSLPNVISLGDTTGGGSGNPIILTLPNGWTYWVPRWIMYTTDYKTYEGIGLAPDIPVQISTADSLASHDTILERAIFELNK
jgi:hypothetical protein